MKKIRLICLILIISLFGGISGVCAEVNDTGRYLKQLSEMINKYNTDNYFCAITMNLGETEYQVDGETFSVETDAVPNEENGEVVLPAEPFVEMVSDVEVVGLESDESPMLSAEDVENLFDCEVKTDGEEIFITRDFQSCRIIVFSSNADDTGAVAKIVHGNKTILQYETVKEAKKGYELNVQKGYNAEPDGVVTMETSSWGHWTVGAPEYHEQTGSDGEEVVVAVVDSGIYAEHYLFKNRLVPGYDFIAFDDIPNDNNGHGSHVSSCVLSVAHYNKNVKIMPLRVFDSTKYTFMSWVAAAIDYAVENKADIINLSLGGYLDSDDLKTSVNNALKNNVVVVASAGNDRCDISVRTFQPACIPGVIGVSAVDWNNNLASFSNYGEGVIDFAAPGDEIMGAHHEAQLEISKSGTSMAAPHVSGVYALVKSEHPKLNNHVITEVLKKSTQYKGTTDKYGAGIINLADFEKNLNADFEIFDIEGVRAAKTTLDEENNTITVLSSEANASAGFSISALVNSVKDYAVEEGKNISRSGSEGKVYFVAKQENGKEQNFEIYITDLKGQVHTYDVTVKFISFAPLDLLGLRAYSLNQTGTSIQVIADNRESSVGFAPVLDDMFDYELVWRTSSAGGTKISTGSTEGYVSGNTGNTGEYGKVKMNIFPKSNGDKQRLYLRVYLKEDKNAYQDFALSIDYVFDPDAVKFNDIVTLRADKVEFEETTKTIKITVDRFNVCPSSKSGTVGFGVVTDSDVKVSYKFDAQNSTNEQTDFKTTTSTAKYSSYKTGVNAETSNNGAYGKVKLYFVDRTAVTSRTTVTLTQGGKSTTYNVTIVLRDMATEGNVSVKGVEVLRANKDSVVVDNANKTIYFEAPKKYTSAGIAVAVNNGLDSNTRTRRIITAVKGYNLAHGNINKTANPELADKFDRYVVVRRSMGLEQTFKVVVHGGKEGRTSTVYTVTVKFV